MVHAALHLSCYLPQCIASNNIPSQRNTTDWTVRPYVRSARSASSEETHGARSWHGAIHMSREDHTFQTRVLRSPFDGGKQSYRMERFKSAEPAPLYVLLSLSGRVCGKWESAYSSSSIGSSENNTVCCDLPDRLTSAGCGSTAAYAYDARALA